MNIHIGYVFQCVEAFLQFPVIDGAQYLIKNVKQSTSGMVKAVLRERTRGGE